MGEEKHDGLVVPGRVVLAREPPFNLGPLTVRPATREVVSDAVCHMIEPRVMQVLVALARAGGEVVSRDELIERCWSGRIVGDDAINHAISKLRQLASDAGGAFAIETIPRVGFRLASGPGNGMDDRRAAPPTGDPGARPNRRLVVGSGIALGALAIAGGSAAWLSRRSQPPRLARMYYERGLATRGQGYPNDYEQAVGYFRRAIEIDPDFADAWGALAWSYRVLLATTDRPDRVHLARLARSAAQRAIELDGTNADARLALLLLEPSYRRWAEVEAGCRKLLMDKPDHSLSRFHLAFVLGDTGRWREAIPHMEAVCKREPTWPMARFRLFEELANSGRIEEADASLAEAMRLAPRNSDFWASKISHLLLTGRHDNAVALLEDAVERPDDEALIGQHRLIVGAYTSGSSERRQAAVASLLEDPGAHPMWIAKIAAMLNERDSAFSLLEGAFFGRGPFGAKRETRPPTHPLFSADTRSLRDDPRFAELIEETGLEAFWQATGTQPDFRTSSEI